MTREYLITNTADGFAHCSVELTPDQAEAVARVAAALNANSENYAPVLEIDLD